MNEQLEQALQQARKTLNPDEFMRLIAESHDPFSSEFATVLDDIETLPTKHLFLTGPMTAMAGHSLGYLLKASEEKKDKVSHLQRNKIHGGHFPETREEGGDWYRCDRDPKSLDAIRKMVGNFKDGELVFSHKGLSDLLGDVISTFYNPGSNDWRIGKTGICFLGKEFLSDQKIIESTLAQEIERADRYGAFQGIPKPSAKSLMLGIQPDAKGIYDEQDIIDYVKRNAAKIRILHLSHIVFSTGQKLDLNRIMSELQPVIAEHNIIVGVDLAHTLGNQTIDLPSLNINYAVGCSYKYVSGTAGTGGCLYVRKTDLSKTPPIRGWTGGKDPSQIFKYIDGEKLDEEQSVEMHNKGAVAFARSNPSPIAVAALQMFAQVTEDLGWDKIAAKSECLTRYMIAMLKHHLGDNLELITPEDPERRGAMIVFRIKGLYDVQFIETLLKEKSSFGSFDIDTRPPHNIRMTPHWGYTEFSDIYRAVSRLTEVVQQLLTAQAAASLAHGLLPEQALADNKAMTRLNKVVRQFLPEQALADNKPKLIQNTAHCRMFPPVPANSSAQQPNKAVSRLNKMAHQLLPKGG